MQLEKDLRQHADSGRRVPATTSLATLSAIGRGKLSKKLTRSCSTLTGHFEFVSRYDGAVHEDRSQLLAGFEVPLADRAVGAPGEQAAVGREFRAANPPGVPRQSSQLLTGMHIGESQQPTGVSAHDGYQHVAAR